MLNTINNIKIEGYLGNDPKIIETKKSTFMELSVSTGRPVLNESTGDFKIITEWHKVMIFDKELIEQIKAFKLTKGTKVSVFQGALSYRIRTIKDDSGKVITKVKEAFIVPHRVFPI